MLEEKQYTVWMNGYRATCEHETAKYLGTHKAKSFKEACRKALIKNKYTMSYYTESNNTFWGRSFFDNETDARKQFG